VKAATYPFEERPVVFGRREQTACVSRRSNLPAGAVIEGPAVVIEETATTVVPPGATARVDGFGTLVIKMRTEDV
jgi:N-methylhydantoinase A